MKQVLLLLSALLMLSVSLLANNNTLQFDGSGDYLDYIDPLACEITNTFTIEAWVYHNTLPGSVQRYVTLGADVACIRHDGSNSPGQLHFYIKRANGNTWDIRVNDALQLGQWYHVAGTFDGTTMKLYLNGVEVGSSNPTEPELYANNGVVRISSPGECMNGMIDEVRIWNTARTAAEITGLDNVEISGSESGLKAYFQLNEGTDTIAVNRCRTEDNEGDIFGNPVWVESTTGLYSAPASGTGSEADPVLIGTLDELGWITKSNVFLSLCYALTADIDASETTTWNEGTGWIPIGGYGVSETVPHFTGDFHGRGHTISNLYINRCAERNAFIGFADGCEIDSLNLTNIDYHQSYRYTGGFIGIMWASTVRSCSVSGNIECVQNEGFGYDSLSGGFLGSLNCAVGEDRYSIIDHCSSAVSINDPCGYMVSGFCGWLGSRLKAIIRDCHASGCIRGDFLVSGFLVNTRDKVIVADCSFTGEVVNLTSNHESGGIMFGLYYGGGAAEVPNLLGPDTPKFSHSNFYDYDNSSLDGEHIYTNQALHHDDFIAWKNAGTQPDINDFLDSDGTDYLVSSVQDLMRVNIFGHRSDYCYRLTTDLDLTDYPEFSMNRMAGTFDGNAHVIKSLKITTDKAKRFEPVGFFSQIDSLGTVTKLGLEEVELSGFENEGALTGRNYGVIERCWASGTVSGKVNTGGLVGENIGSIELCYFTGTVSGLGDTGGLVGENRGRIENCYSFGAVTWGNSATPVGGFCGCNNQGIIRYCYSAGGPVTGYGFLRRAITGGNYEMSHNFWGINSSGCETTMGEATGVADYKLRSCRMLVADGWSFKELNGTDGDWNIHTAWNQSYPVLSWQQPESGGCLWGGDGSTENPYQIWTFSDLYLLYNSSYDLCDNYLQMTDMNMSYAQSIERNPGYAYNWSGLRYLIGNYNGNGYCIDSLSVSFHTESLTLFYAINGSLSNFNLTNVDLHGSYVFPLCSRVGACHISNCHVTGSIEATSNGCGLIYGMDSIYGGVVTRCSFEGTISAGSNVGGIVVYGEGGMQLIECWSKGTLISQSNANIQSFAGGIVAYDINISITRCYSSCDIYGSYKVGGISGSQYRSSITDCYFNGSVHRLTGSPSETLASVAGYAHSPNQGSINHTYTVGPVINDDAENPTDRGFVIYSGEYPNNGNFFDTEATGQITGNGATPASTADMKLMGTYINAGWDFAGETNNGTDDVWGMNPEVNSGYPFLMWEGYENTWTAPVVCSDSLQNLGIGVATLRGEIQSVGSLDSTTYGLCWSRNSTPTIADSMLVLGTTSQPITYSARIDSLAAGETYYYRAFASSEVGVIYGDVISFTTLEFPGGSGTADDPYLVANAEQLNRIRKHLGSCYRQIEDIDLMALCEQDSLGWLPIGNASGTFTGIYDGQKLPIRNLSFDRTAPYTGLFGIVGSNAVLENIMLSDISLSGGSYLGGLAGKSSGTIEECSCTGSVAVNSASDYCGGLVGENLGNVSECYTNVAVTGWMQVGGMFGSANSGIVSDCYSLGSVHGMSYMGGFAGVIGSQAVLSHCYSTGQLGSGSNVGGFAGYRLGSVADCFWDTETSGLATSAGGTGCPTLQMKSSTTFINAGWDFVSESVNGTVDLWNRGIGANNGYPFLVWQNLAIALAAPQHVVISESGGTLLITWDEVESASWYQIYSAAAANAEFPGEWVLESTTDVTHIIIADIEHSFHFYRIVASTENPAITRCYNEQAVESK